jgi:hypothetical protein
VECLISRFGVPARESSTVGRDYGDEGTLTAPSCHNAQLTRPARNSFNGWFIFSTTPSRSLTARLPEDGTAKALPRAGQGVRLVGEADDVGVPGVIQGIPAGACLPVDLAALTAYNTC